MDELGNHWQRASDAFGRLTQVMEPSATSQTPSMETDYVYDALSNLLSVNQWGGANGSSGERKRTFNYDSLSRLLTSYNPETGTLSYAYDANSNLSAKTDARGIATSYRYDALNRVISKTYSSDTSGTPISCFQYDTSSIPGAGGNLIGRLTNAWTQPKGSSSCTGTAPSFAPVAGSYLSLKSILAYDSMGRPASAQQQQCVNGTCAALTPYSLTMAYDLAGNMTTLTNNVGADGQSLTLNNYFDGAGRPCLTTATTSPTSTSSWSPNFAANLFQVNPGTTTPGYAPFGGLLNWYMGSSSSTASTSCGTTPASPINITQGYTNRLWVNSILATGQIP
jgi:YD repeat-containing protein